ncbi:hypothetical protein [Rhizobacter sp. P5_C2]
MPLYDDLHRRTALVAEHRVQEALCKVTSSEATQLLHKQLRGLQEFIAGEPAELRPDRRADDPLLASLRGFVADDVTRSVGDDAALAKDLSREFAVGLWDVLLRQMTRSASGGSAVHRTDLELSGEGDAGSKWEELDKALTPYGLRRDDAGAILRAVLTQLHDAAKGEQIGLPLGLAIDKAMLTRLLRGEPEPPAQKRGVFEILHDVITGSGRS